MHFPGLLHAALKLSTHAHARIKSIDTSKAKEAEGVQTVITGDDYPITLGLYMGDKPPLAHKKVRYYGEPVAAVIANTEQQARAALNLIKVEYEELPIVSSAREAIKEGAPLIHEDMSKYIHIPAVIPVPGKNISNHTKIRKGDIQEGFEKADVVIEASFAFPLVIMRLWRPDLPLQASMPTMILRSTLQHKRPLSSNPCWALTSRSPLGRSM